MKNRKALLVIDMQKGSFTALTPRHDTDGVVQRINLMAEAFRTLRGRTKPARANFASV